MKWKSSFENRANLLHFRLLNLLIEFKFVLCFAGDLNYPKSLFWIQIEYNSSIHIQVHTHTHLRNWNIFSRYFWYPTSIQINYSLHHPTVNAIQWKYTKHDTKSRFIWKFYQNKIFWRTKRGVKHYCGYFTAFYLPGQRTIRDFFLQCFVQHSMWDREGRIRKKCGARSRLWLLGMISMKWEKCRCDVKNNPNIMAQQSTV